MKAILSKTTSDLIKSKIKSPRLSELVFEVYISPSEFGRIIEEYDDKVFELEIKKSEDQGRQIL